MNKNVVVVAGAAAVVGVGLLVAYGIMKKGEETRTLVLTGTAENCTTTDPGALGNRKGKNIVWRVTNNCGVDRYVQFQNFKRRHLDNGNEFDPQDNAIVDPYPAGGAVPAGATVNITTKINKGPKWGVIIDTYKYDVYLGANAGSLTPVLDPDVEIWP
jgi:hypothetical protein